MQKFAPINSSFYPCSFSFCEFIKLWQTCLRNTIILNGRFYYFNNQFDKIIWYIIEKCPLFRYFLPYFPALVKSVIAEQILQSNFAQGGFKALTWIALQQMWNHLGIILHKYRTCFPISSKLTKVVDIFSDL